MANNSNDSRVTNEQVKSLKLGDRVVTGVTLPTTIVETITAGNDGITVGGTAANPTISAKISSESDNGLQIKDTGNKGLYVSAKTLGLSTAYIPKGSMTVSQAATKLSGGEIGWVYNMSDSGTISDGIEGSIVVEAGDNVVIVNNGTEETPVKKWDKLSATIDIPVYTGSGVIDVTGTTISLTTKATGGLDTTGDELGVKLDGNSLAVGANGLKVNAKTNGGLNIDSAASGGGLEVNVGNGLEIPSSGTDAGKVRVKAADTTISSAAGGVSVNRAANGGLVESSGLKVDVDNSSIKLDGSGKVALKASATGGLDTTDSTNGVSVKTGGGLQKNSTDGTISVKPNAAKAIEVDATDGVGVVAGNNVAVSSAGVVVDVDKSTAITDNTTIEQLIGLLGGAITAAT